MWNIFCRFGPYFHFQNAARPGKSQVPQGKRWKMATLGEKFEEFCTSLKANPPAWVRAEIDGAAA